MLCLIDSHNCTICLTEWPFNCCVILNLLKRCVNLVVITIESTISEVCSVCILQCCFVAKIDSGCISILSVQFSKYSNYSVSEELGTSIVIPLVSECSVVLSVFYCWGEELSPLAFPLLHDVGLIAQVGNSITLICNIINEVEILCSWLISPVPFVWNLASLH